MLRWVPILWLLAEVAGFALAGRVLGVFGTLALLALTTMAGVGLLRQRGRAAARALSGGSPFGAGLGLGRDAARDPGRALRDGGFGVVAGMLLVLPGFLSDGLALLLLLPPVQRALVRRLGVSGQGRATASPRAGSRADPGVVDAEWVEIAPAPRPGATAAPGRSGWTRPD